MALSGSVNTSSYEGRYYQLSWTATQNVTNNTSTISWTLKAVGGTSSWYAERTLKAVINGTTVYTKTNRVERYTGNIQTGTTTITHNTDGSKSFSVSVQAAVYGESVNCTGSKSFTLDTIARASTLTASNGTLNTAQTLTVSRQSTSFTHTITYKCGSTSGTIATKSTSTSISWTPPLSLATQNKTGTSVSVTFTIETFNGSTSIGKKTKTITCSIPASVKPTVSLSVSDAKGYYSTYGRYIQNMSKISVTVSASGSQGSTIESRKTTIDGKTYTGASFTTDVISSSSTSLTISTTVTDSRGRTATTSSTIYVYNYSPPQVSALSVYRDVNNNLAVKYSAKVTSLSAATKTNTATYQIQYKKKSATSYTTVTDSTQANIFNFSNRVYTITGTDANSSYDVIVIAKDSFTSTNMTSSGSTAAKLFSIFRKGMGWAFGKVAEKENTVEFGFDASFDGDVYGKAYGLGALPEIPETANLNDYTEPGCWCIPNNSRASTMKTNGLNVPLAYAGRLIVENSTGWDDPNSNFKYRTQTYIPYLTNHPTMVRHIRKTSATSWNYENPWQTLCFPNKDISLTLNTGFSYKRYYITRHGDIVTMFFAGTYNTTKTGPFTIAIGNIGSDFPGGSVSNAGAQGNSMIIAWVTSAGVVNVRFTENYTANAQFEFTLTWNVDGTWTVA